MVILAVTVISIAIVVSDIESHRIPNRLTLLLGTALLFDEYHTDYLVALPAALVAVIIGYLGKFGAGDVKLFLVLLLTSGPLILRGDYFLGMATVSVALILLTRFFMGPQVKMIAFAPAIVLPVLHSYLAI